VGKNDMENDLDKECKQCGLDSNTHIFDCPLGHTKHNFKYSHQEIRQAQATGTNIIYIDVVVCTDCGIIKRNIK